VGGRSVRALHVVGLSVRSVVGSRAEREPFRGSSEGAALAVVRRRVVVLNACYSSAQAEALLAYVDCVVGMRSAIDDHAARNFAIGFYGALGDGESVATALAQGGAAISLEGLHEGARSSTSASVSTPVSWSWPYAATRAQRPRVASWTGPSALPHHRRQPGDRRRPADLRAKSRTPC